MCSREKLWPSRLWTLGVAIGSIVLSVSSMSAAVTGSIRLVDGLGLEVLSYDIGDTLYVQVRDTDRDTDVAQADTLSVVVASAQELSGEGLVLTETGVNTGVFSGWMLLAESSPVVDGVLQVARGSKLTVVYSDPFDDFGHAASIQKVVYYRVTLVSGTLWTDTVWGVSDSPFLVTGDVTVNEGAHLTVEPGVEVRFVPLSDDQSGGDDQNRAELIVEGQLTAVGTAIDTIVFTSNSESPASGDWYGISFGLSMQTTHSKGCFAYTCIAYGTYGVKLNGLSASSVDTLKVQHCRIHNAGTGISSWGYDQHYLIEDNVLESISGDGISILGSRKGWIRGNTVDGNIRLGGSLLGISQFEVSGNTVTSSAVGYGNGIEISSVTEAAILHNEVSAGWAGIRIENVMSTQITGNVLSNHSGWGLWISRTNAVVDSNRISNNSHGVNITTDVEHPTTDTLRYNTIVNNSQIGIQNEGCARAVVQYNNLYDNGAFAGYDYTNISTVWNELDARFNWWGVSTTALMDTGGNPKALPKIYDVYDDPDLGFVNYAGWLSAEVNLAPPDPVVLIPDTSLDAAIREAIGKLTGNLTESDLVSLDSLAADTKGIVSLSGIEHCLSLTYLQLGGNQIVAISPLSGLMRLTNLDLEDNQISDMSPLVGNSGLGVGDTVVLTDNPLNAAAFDVHIPALLARGVEVVFDPPAEFSVTPASLAFGNVTTGQSKQMVLLVSNGGGRPLDVTSTTVSGPSAAEFTVSPTTLAVASGASDTLTVTFSPSSEGGKSAALSIAHNTEESPTAVALSGTGIIPAVSGTHATDKHRVSVGDTVTVAVNMAMASGKALGGFTAVTQWDESKLAYVDIQHGEFGAFAATFANADTVRYGGINLAGLAGTGSIAVIRLKVIGGKGTSTSIATSCREAYDVTTFENLLPIDVVPLTIEIIAGLCGDVDRDDHVGIRDALILATYVINPTVTFPECTEVMLGDVDSDGQLSIRDALMIATCAVNPDNPNLPPGIGQKPAPLFVENVENGDAIRLMVQPGGMTRAYAFVLNWCSEDLAFLQMNHAPVTHSIGAGVLRLAELDSEGLTPLEIEFQVLRPLTHVSLHPWIDAVASDFSEGQVALNLQIIPRRPSLSQNSPNPFNPETTIRYGLPWSGKAQLKVYNVLGQEIRILQDGLKPAGIHRVVWDGRDAYGRTLASGVYLYRLVADDFRAVKRMLLLR